jgi:hypothetical protein
MKRIALVVITGIVLMVLSVAMQGAAWGGGTSPGTPVITFDNAAQAAQLTIPASSCNPSGPNCQWKFYLTEPSHSLVVGNIDGSSGTLIIPYPAHYCGTMEAEAYVGQASSPAVQETVSGCCWPSPSTTLPTPTPTSQPTPTPTSLPTPTPTPAPTSTSTTLAVANGPTGATLPPSAAAASSPPAGSVAATSVTPTGEVSTAVPTAVPATKGPTSLPFTGVDIKALFFTGLSLVALGLSMLVRRRARVR